MDQKSEAECFNTIESKQDFYYGRYWVFGKFRTNEYLFAIGPHWWVFILGFSFILGMGMMIYFPLQEFIGFWYKFAFKLFLFLVLFAYFLTFLVNPGIIPVSKSSQKLADKEQNVKISCEKCQTLATVKAEHCPDCDICILELDHHCVWTGKCIGKKNLYLFYVFVSLVPTFFVFVMFMAIQVSAKSQQKAK